MNVRNDKVSQILNEELNSFVSGDITEMYLKHLYFKAEIENLLTTKRDFLEGRTTAREWKDIEEDLNIAFKNE